MIAQVGRDPRQDQDLEKRDRGPGVMFALPKHLKFREASIHIRQLSRLPQCQGAFPLQDRIQDMMKEFQVKLEVDIIRLRQRFLSLSIPRQPQGYHIP